jgi:hypothetical protein
MVLVGFYGITFLVLKGFSCDCGGEAVGGHGVPVPGWNGFLYLMVYGVCVVGLKNHLF